MPGPYRGSGGWMPSIIDLAAGRDYTAAAPAIAQAAAPEPTIGSRIVSALGAATDYIPPVNLLKALGQQISTRPQRLAGEIEAQRLANERAAQEVRLAQAQFPAQEGLAAAQARQFGAIDARLGTEADPDTREALIRGSATGTFRPFHVEPGPAELAAYENVLGMQQEEARQRLIGQRESAQARLEAQLQQMSTAARLAGELELEKGKRALGPEAAKLSDVGALRGQYLGEVKDFGKYRDAAEGIEVAAQNETGAGDLALVYNFIKLMDPNAVKEGEYALTESAAQTIPEKYRNDFNRLVGNKANRLSPAAKAELLAVARPLFGSRLQSYESTRRQFGEIAARSGMRPEDVIIDLKSPERPKAPAPRKTINGSEYEKVDGGWRLVQ